MRTSGRRVQEFNAKVYAAKGMNCYVCGVALDNSNKSVDHIKPYATYPELEFDLDNAVPCCMKHNQEKGAKTGITRVSWINEKYLEWSVIR